MGVLSIIDRNALVRYCVTYARWRKVAENLASMDDETYEHTNKGGSVQVQVRPEVHLEAKLATALLRLEQEFGLTPSSRTGIEVQKTPATDGMAKFFARKPLKMRPKTAASKPVKKSRRRKARGKRNVKVAAERKRDARGRFAKAS